MLSDYGLCVKWVKSEFFKESVEYLGHIIDKNGKHPSDSSTDDINRLLSPQANKLARPFLAINRQPLELESCSNPLRIQQVF